MSQLLKLSLDVLYQIILPIFLVLGSGLLLSRKLGLKRAPAGQADGLRAFSTLVFYLLSPCLAFSSLATSDLGAAQVGQIGSFVVVMTLAPGVAVWALARLLRLSPHETSSLLLVAMFGNVGNYGLPLNELAFGQGGLDRAVIYMVITAVFVFSLGVMIAAHAQGNAPAQALGRLARVPIIYALLLGGLVRVGLLPLPDPILNATTLLARGATPLMLLILGLQLSQARIRGNWRLIALACSARLLLTPLIAVPLAAWMGLTGLTGQVAIVEACMPSAVFSIILAVEFNLDRDLATGVVLSTTLFSPLTLVPLIAYLR